eukprot:scaffold4150_cov129-Skeletonema_marinoi.AAC.2
MQTILLTFAVLSVVFDLWLFQQLQRQLRPKGGDDDSSSMRLMTKKKRLKQCRRKNNKARGPLVAIPSPLATSSASSSRSSRMSFAYSLPSTCLLKSPLSSSLQSRTAQP